MVKLLNLLMNADVYLYKLTFESALRRGSIVGEWRAESAMESAALIMDQVMQYLRQTHAELLKGSTTMALKLTAKNNPEN